MKDITFKTADDSFQIFEEQYVMVVDKNDNLEGYVPIKKMTAGEGDIILNQKFSRWLAQQRLTGEQYSVLFALFSHLDFENYLRIGLKEIADLLNMQITNVSRAMKKLKELEIIIESHPAGRFKTYRLNPNIACQLVELHATVVDFDTALEKK